MTDRSDEDLGRIGAKMVVQGDVRGAGDLLVSGRMAGTLRLEGRLEVSASGVVKARIFAASVVIEGTVVGDVDATESIHLAESARVSGNLRAPRVRIAEGARLAGRVDVGAAATEIDATAEAQTSGLPEAEPGGPKALVLFHEGPTRPPESRGPETGRAERGGADEGPGATETSEPPSPAASGSVSGTWGRASGDGPRRKKIVVKKRS